MLNFKGKGTASDYEINTAATDIFNILRNFDSPKDAASVLTIAHVAMTKAAFPPEYRKEAIASIDAEAELVKRIIMEGYQ